MTPPAAALDSEGANGAAASRPAPLAALIFALLVVACFAAFFISQRLKHTPTLVQRFERTPSFTPSGRPPGNLEQISFKLAGADDVTVAVIDVKGNVVATRVRDRPVARYKQFSLRWNGRRGTTHHFRQLATASGRPIVVPVNTGRLAPPGEYRVRVSLRKHGGSVLSPFSFTLVGQ
ncbi:MAG: hypothetical protein JWO23_2024 [Solirubrobacterales bacterium]|nr:hypothetical protein [Solirubrobacterales bacterium]